MATRARIGIQQKDGTIISAYQHWDGYLSGLGYNLCEHWTDAKKVLKAIKLGNSSKWGQIIGQKIDFDDRSDEMHDVQNVYYMRDRGEKDQGPITFKNWGDYLKNGFNSGEEYIYLMMDTGEKDFLGKPIGTWSYAHYDDATGFNPVEEKAIKEHIEELQRYLKDKKERKAA
jgi:hypothetical protein